jgi:EAL domain-containing protein (putative c-di-GMP-specific phosphodiesterase class I)/ActR/RegA family two-component response regulator
MDSTPPKGTLLILDDDEAVSFTIQAIAKRAGFQVHTTTVAAEFFSLLESWRPSHVVIDLVMPDVDGLQILHELSERAYRGNIVISSGLGQRILDAAGRTADAYGLNFAGLLPKPFSPDQLRALLNQATARAAQSGRAAAALAEHDLVQALDNHWIQPYFQPKIVCRTGQYCGVEVLARLIHPETGLIPPDSFIPLAERTGLITPLTLQILDASLAWLTRHTHERHGLSLNLSRYSTDRSFAEKLVGLCKKHSVHPSRLTLEVTETAHHTSEQELLEFLTRFRIQGFHLSIDDFGVGYSSLVELARLPFSELKIDKRFVQNLAGSTESQKICAAIVGLGKALELEVTAEGVEDAQALAFLTEIGCDHAQGYYMAKPMPAGETAQWIQQRAHPYSSS